MSTVKVEVAGPAPTPKTVWKVGAYYMDVSRHGGQRVYIATRGNYLVNVADGTSYTGGDNRFGGDDEDFVMLQSVTVKVQA